MQRYLALPSGVCGVQTPITAGLALYLGVNICKVGLIIVPTPRTGLGIERFKACEELGCLLGRRGGVLGIPFCIRWRDPGRPKSSVPPPSGGGA